MTPEFYNMYKMSMNTLEILFEKYPDGIITFG